MFEIPFAGTVNTSAKVLLPASYLFKTRLLRFPDVAVIVIFRAGNGRPPSKTDGVVSGPK